jgi:D-sedoheptulose 7-phosphate isomerase
MKKNNFDIRIKQIISSFELMNEIKADFNKTANLMLKTLKKKNKIIFCGNGGSAADSSHAVAELVGRYLKKRRKPLRAISLNENSATLTALSNDFGYRFVFSRQLESLGRKNDLLFAISTSGKSKNILEVIRAAKKLNIKTIMLTGDNSFNTDLVNICIKVPAKRVDRIQELHIAIIHLLSEYLDERF